MDDAGRRRISLALMTASGFAGLGYQIVWTQQSAAWLGHESAAVLAVVAAFFGGLALGAWCTGQPIERSRRPARWYAAAEATIALWGLALLWLMPAWGDWTMRATGADPSPVRQWTIAFCATFVVLLPATAAMGATLPAIERMGVPGRGERSIAAHYASNTTGAVLGVLSTALWLVPALGLRGAASVCIALNVACAATAWRLFDARRAAERTAPAVGRAQLLNLAWTGFLGIGYEVIAMRVLAQVTENTVYTFAMVLAVYLAGTAIGAALHRRSTSDRAAGDRAIARVSIACLLGAGALWGAGRTSVVLHAVLPSGMASAVAAEAVLAVAAFALPTIAMGALFSELSARAAAAGLGFGRALGANTLGAMLAPPVFGVVVAPLFGSKVALLAIPLGYLALVARSSWKRPAAWGPAATVAMLALAAPELAFVDVPEGARLVSHRDGVMAAVRVVEDEGGVSRLYINNRQQEGSSATRFVDARQALLPLLLHPAPARALFLGLGTGVTASWAAADPALDVDAVELLPEVIEASRHFAAPGARRPHVVAADARRYVRATAVRYDVIVADNFHPARSGSGALYAVEHFRAVRDRLSERGVFCQWLPLHQLDLDPLRSIVASFVAAFPDGRAILASNSLETPVIGLVGGRGPMDLQRAGVRRRMADLRLPTPLERFGLPDELAVLGSFVAGPAALARFAGDAVVNSDDRPVVAHAAPRVTYAPTSSPRDRLLGLLHVWTVAPDDVLSAASDPADLTRLAAYRAARDRFLEIGRAVRPSNDAATMLARVKDPLLAVLRISPDFRPARDPLLRMADALDRSDPAAARSLRAELREVDAGMEPR